MGERAGRPGRKPLARYGAMDGALARGLRLGVAASWAFLKLMGSLIWRPETPPAPSISRDDHGLLCRNRRVIGTVKRMRVGRRRQDRSRGEGRERAGGADCVAWQSRSCDDADRAGGGASVAMVVFGGEAGGSGR